MRRHRGAAAIALLAAAVLLAAALLQALTGAIIKRHLGQMPVVTASPSPEPEPEYVEDTGRAAGFTT